jgi:hypothetical protein
VVLILHGRTPVFLDPGGRQRFKDSDQETHEISLSIVLQTFLGSVLLYVVVRSHFRYRGLPWDLSQLLKYMTCKK